MSKLNPQICSIEVGRKTLKEVTIYPLSLTDQFRTTDLISDLVTKTVAFLEKTKTSEETSEEAINIAVIQEIASSIEANLAKILDFVVDSGEKIDLDDLTNLQFSELADLIFDVNYAGAVGNFQGLVSKVKTLLQSTRPSQPSLQEQAIDSNTSSQEVSEMEE